ncbi:MAG: TetR/AcrR family transcriptional regulator [Acidimicrobiales bacterium]
MAIAQAPRPVQDRAVATRAALLDAALECLVERGYAASTTTEVARRAGVSRGAQLHHFPTKTELLTAAVEHLCQRRTAEFRAAFADADPGPDRVEAAIDLLWSMFAGPTFVAWAELWLASRTDPDLRRAVVDMDRRFIRDSQAVFTELFPPQDGLDPRFHQIGLGLAFALMEGLAMQRLNPCGHLPRPEEVLDAFKLMTRVSLMAAGTEPETTPEITKERQ